MYSTKPAPPLRKVKLPRLSFDPALPVSARRDEIRAAIERHQVVIVCGETGSGKTTQLPKILLEMGRGAAGLIGHTQPRRIAARSSPRASPRSSAASSAPWWATRCASRTGSARTRR